MTVLATLAGLLLAWLAWTAMRALGARSAWSLLASVVAGALVARRLWPGRDTHGH